MFVVILHVLPISGTDIVLKIEWLKHLGPITINYTSFAMSFTHLGQPDEPRADVSYGPTDVSS